MLAVYKEAVNVLSEDHQEHKKQCYSECQAIEATLLKVKSSKATQEIFAEAKQRLEAAIENTLSYLKSKEWQ